MRPIISRGALPDHALLCRYARNPGTYTDCFTATLPYPSDLERFVAAFYTSPLFRIERRVLGIFARRPSADDQARQVAAGTREEFAVWTVEARTDFQLLMRDNTGRTRSWFMVEPAMGDAAQTLLTFGSAVLPRRGAEGLGAVGMILGLHRLYSRALMSAAMARLAKAS